MHILYLISGYLGLIAYSNEKISVLMPYSKLDAVVVIIVSFIIFQDVSVFSFLIGILILLISVFGKINFKEVKFSRNIIYVIIARTIGGICGVLTGYILKDISEIDFFMYERISFFTVTFFFLFITMFKYKKEDFIFPKTFYISRFFNFFFWAVGALIGLFIIKSLGLVVSSILGFLGMGITLVMSYFIFGDKPSKKDIILTIIITILVFLGFYFR
ncbi:MAG: hypothetical protein N4A38_00130 [Candidatus Gracilibacteria bacterium]|nr:hypothetical protein [Candidatus Gracilibacteria bacterium]